MTPLSALSCLWDDPDRCPQVRRDGLTGLRYCRLCGAEDEPPGTAESPAEAGAASTGEGPAPAE